MILSDDIVDIEKLDGIYSLTFVVDEFSGFFYIHQSIILNIQDLHKQQMLLYQIFDID